MVFDLSEVPHLDVTASLAVENAALKQQIAELKSMGGEN